MKKKSFIFLLYSLLKYSENFSVNKIVIINVVFKTN